MTDANPTDVAELQALLDDLRAALIHRDAEETRRVLAALYARPDDGALIVRTLAGALGDDAQRFGPHLTALWDFDGPHMSVVRDPADRQLPTSRNSL